MPYLDLGTQGIAGELEPNLVIALKQEWEVLRGHPSPGCDNTHTEPLRSCLAPATALLVMLETLDTEGKDPLSRGIIPGPSPQLV